MDTKLNAEQQEFLNTIHMSGDHLLMVINDILDYSKIESGQLELEEHPFELDSCIEDVLDLSRPLVGTKPLELLNFIDSDICKATSNPDVL